jgi:protein-S-isoprenylcysteine O-methyltransferase Ste14
MTMSAPRPSRDRWRFLWAAITLALAAYAFFAITKGGAWTLAVYLVLNVQIAILFIRRGPAVTRARGFYPYAVALACVPWLWLYEVRTVASAPSQYLGWAFFAVGAAIVFAAAWTLGTAYGVLPIARGVRSHGVYRVVRHPLCLGYLCMGAGLVAQSPTRWNVLVALGGAAMLAWRARCEEAVLAELSEYRRYCARTRFRLIPFVY